MSNKHKHSPPKQGSSDSHAQPAQHCDVDPSRIYSVKVESDPKDKERHSEEEAYRKESLRHAKRLNIITGVAAGFTGLAAGFAALYAGISYSQWQDAHHNFMIENRTWLNAAIPQISHDRVPNPVRVSVSVINSGKSPAFGISTYASIELVNWQNPPVFSSFTNRISIGLLSPNETSNFPDQQTIAIALTPDQMSGLTSGDFYLAVIGSVIYSDQFGKHWTDFCVWTAFASRPPGPQGYHAQSCSAWNATDGGGSKPPGEILPLLNGN